MPRINPEFDPNEMLPPPINGDTSNQDEKPPVQQPARPSTTTVPPNPNITPSYNQPAVQSTPHLPRVPVKSPDNTRRNFIIGVVGTMGFFTVAYFANEQEKQIKERAIKAIATPTVRVAPKPAPTVRIVSELIPTRIPPTATPDRSVRKPVAKNVIPTSTPVPVRSLSVLPSFLLSDVETGQSKSSLSSAKEIMGADFYGHEEIKSTFGVTIPPEKFNSIPFDEKELERARKRNFFLILRTNQAPDGSPLTIRKMTEILPPDYASSKVATIISPATSNQYGSETFFNLTTPREGWSFISKVGISGSNNNNYLHHTEMLAGYIKDTFYRDSPIPAQVNSALEELGAQKSSIVEKLLTDPKTTAEKLAFLKLNQIGRQSPVEVLFDYWVFTHNRNSAFRLWQHETIWTNELTSDRKFVNLGPFNTSYIDIGTKSVF